VTNADGQQMAGSVRAGSRPARSRSPFGPDGLLSSGGGARWSRVGSRTLVISTVSGYAEVQ